MVIQSNGSSKTNLMLINKTYEAYVTWWEYWLSKLPQNRPPAERSNAKPLKPLKPNADSSAYRARVLQRLKLNSYQNGSVHHTGAESWED
jgi:hypothetical protein